MKKRILSLILATAMVFTMVGCGNTSSSDTSTDDSKSSSTAVTTDTVDDTANTATTEEGKYQVGIVLPTKDEPRWLQDQASFEAILDEAGFTSTVLFSQGSSATELTNVETLLSQGIKVLIICAQDATAAAAAVEKAHEQGVTVVCYDRLITDTNAVDYYVTFNSFDVGVKQGQFLIDAYAGQTGVPLYLYSGATTDNNAFIFFTGAWSVLNQAVANGQFVVENCDTISAYSGVALDATADHEAVATILEKITTNWDFDDAKSLAEAHLIAASSSAKGDVAVLAPNDGTARAISDAFYADKDITSIVITGQDCETASVDYILQGLQSMTIWKNTATLAATTCDLVNAILSGTTPSTSTSYNNGVIDVPSAETEVTIITKDNVSEPVDAGYIDASNLEYYN